MQNRTDFESEWEKAFAGAEAEVSDAVWEKIALKMADEKDRKTRKRLLLFQLLTAASVSFALSVGGLGIYHLYLKDNDTSDLQSGMHHNNSGPVLSMNGDENGDEDFKVTENGAAGGSENTDSDQKKSKVYVQKNNRGKGNYNKEVAVRRLGASGRSPEVLPERTANTITTKDLGAPKTVTRRFEYLDTAPLADFDMEMVPWYNYIPVQKKPMREMWAGIGFSTGSFNPNVNAAGNTAVNSGGMRMSTLAFDANSKRTPAFSEERAGYTYNIGFNIGTALSEKWILQSGMVYMQQQSSSTSNVASSAEGSAPAALNNLAGISSTEAMIFTAPYDVSNTYELISIPLQAGYVILDKKINIILLGGISNNILLKNEIEATSGDFEEEEIAAGSGSPYRTYQISGIISSEFSYYLGSHYRLSLVPRLRQSLNSITKPEAEYSSLPTTLEIGFSLKYRFNK